MGIDSGSISLIVAGLDLKLVRLLRGTMNTDECRATPLGPAPNHRCCRGEDRFEPRRILHPTPRYEPRPVLHPTPRVDTGPVLAAPTKAPSFDEVPAPIATSTITPSPIQPPWKSVPKICDSLPSHRPPVVKIVKPLVSYKGLLLDFFV